jgi:hypothetical protein
MTTSAPNRPTHKLYSVCKQKDGKSRWTEIGVAFPHKDGNGFAFRLTAMPAPGGEFVMRRERPRTSQAQG